MRRGVDPYSSPPVLGSKKYRNQTRCIYICYIDLIVLSLENLYKEIFQLVDGFVTYI